MMKRLRKVKPGVHCITNPVSMQDVANLLLAAGGSAIMAQHPAEVEEITGICHATLLNTGVPDAEKFLACELAGRRANELGHPVVIDPVGVGASSFRRTGVEALLRQVHPTIIRCNQEEARVLLHLQNEDSGGVESSVVLESTDQMKLAKNLANAYNCVVLVSGEKDMVSDGTRVMILPGGDLRIARITGSGCMLSALCALFCGAGMEAYEAACEAGKIWKESSRIAGVRTDEQSGGMGCFHVYLFDALDELCCKEEM